MEVRNRDGEPVDPVPFVVCAGLAAMLCFSCGPLYGLAYGVSVRASLAVSAVATIAVTAVAYHRLVWAATPRWVDVPPQFRFERLIYVALALAVVLLALSVPLLVDGGFPGAIAA